MTEKINKEGDVITLRSTSEFTLLELKAWCEYQINEGKTSAEVYYDYSYGGELNGIEITAD